MPPKAAGIPKKILHPDGSTEQVFDIITIDDSSDSSVIMTGRKPVSRAKGKGKAAASSSAIPEVYQDLLAEALPKQPDVPDRPLKRRRTGHHELLATSTKAAAKPEQTDEDEDDEEELEFEDVLYPGNTLGSQDGDPDETPRALQTAYRESDEEESGSEFDWDASNLEAQPEAGSSGVLELTFNSKPTPQPKALSTRRKAVTKEERALRLQIHRMHVLCLLSYVRRRNEWCNDPEVHKLLRPLLSKNTLKFLLPKESLNQFSRANSLKRGLDEVSTLWRTRFRITARGMRRALWADDERDLQNYSLPDDADGVTEKSEFRAAASSLEGSRDCGAQLYCALLRSAGVEARLVCSLQVLSFGAGGPPMPRSTIKPRKPAIPELNDVEDEIEDEDERLVDVNSDNFQFATPGSSKFGFGNTPVSARRRLGHPNAAAYDASSISAPSRPPPKPKAKPIHESPYPVFWVEVLDEAHQKWLAVDPLVTESISKPHVFEPAAADRENAMSYVVAFEEEGGARDVTLRYTKAFVAKTRKNRVECTHGGEKWWRKTMSKFAPGWKTDLEQIEDNELAATAAKEPMPRNVADFKDHPYYALERHLRRNEILVGNHSVGKLAAGRDPGTPGKKKLESIFRRKDVKLVKSADAWYRLGRDVKFGQQPVKTVAPTKRPDLDDDVDMEERAGTDLFTEDQTEVYESPPVIDGRVPKNSFGNIDIYVPSMVPKGGVHVPHPEASRAARLIGIDYADALTGFSFRGCHGTPILTGVVVALEYGEAVQAVVEGFSDERAMAEEEQRARNARKLWKRFLAKLRIKDRIDGYREDGEEEGEEENEEDEGSDAKFEAARDEPDSGMDTEEFDDDEYGGGGFLPD